ncbi:sugar ABC transporter permease [Marispirochaeta aestuarii]|uniref:carbohydrate ABC transporter permease n=1 Tax=Marispirochaeta aestuarii TaxID=1963862 RepID=UPI0029C7AD2C|nr:sugar ABC transporter permease [Marispirochaeta aestuarii]
MAIVNLKGRRRTILFFLLPGMLVYCGLVLYPLMQGFILSTQRWVTLTRRVYVGLENYVSLIHNSIFWTSMEKSAVFVVGTTVLQLVLGFLLGYLLYHQLKGYRIFKTLFFVPVILMTVAVGFIWDYIYSPAFGLLKPFMEFIGMGDRYFPPLADPDVAILFVILAHSWRQVGIQIMLFYAGFMNIPQDVIEMATIEGASGFKMIWYMILPLSWEVSKMVVVLQITAALRAFDLVYVMTKGGPNHSTEVLPMHMFVHAFENFNIGLGSAVAVIIFILSMTLTLILRRVMQRETLQY